MASLFLFVIFLLELLKKQAYLILKFSKLGLGKISLLAIRSTLALILLRLMLLTLFVLFDLLYNLSGFIAKYLLYWHSIFYFGVKNRNGFGKYRSISILGQFCAFLWL